MEDFNVPSPERVALLKCLQELIGDIPPHFWAACQICDLAALEKLVHYEPGVLVGIGSQTSQMVRHCKSNSCVPLL